MGVVYDAYDLILDRHVALKTIDLDREGAERLAGCLKREAKAIARLEHPNIVALHDAGEIDRIYYLVLQLITGETLSSRMKRRQTLPVEDAVRIVLELLAALEYAHSRGVVHRDVKPSNIMIGADESVKLMDFGVAMPVGMGVTTSGMIMGTPDYMSPEQVLGNPVDGRADIFSAGCTLYELLTGRKPFDAEDIRGVIYRVVHEPPAPFEVPLDGRMQEVLCKALAKSAAERFQSCSEFAAQLRQCLPQCSRNRVSGLHVARTHALAAVTSLPALLLTVFLAVAIQEGS
jgi:serine/threonine-protein kinase